jgi:hypothetical protein
VSYLIITPIAKEFQPLLRFQLMAVAILRNRDTTHVLHHEMERTKEPQVVVITGASAGVVF